MAASCLVSRLLRVLGCRPFGARRWRPLCCHRAPWAPWSLPTLPSACACAAWLFGRPLGHGGVICDVVVHDLVPSGLVITYHLPARTSGPKPQAFPPQGRPSPMPPAQPPCRSRRHHAAQARWQRLKRSARFPFVGRSWTHVAKGHGGRERLQRLHEPIPISAAKPGCRGGTHATHPPHHARPPAPTHPPARPSLSTRGKRLGASMALSAA